MRSALRATSKQINQAAAKLWLRRDHPTRIRDGRFDHIAEIEAAITDAGWVISA
jgi:hypothetical protein